MFDEPGLPAPPDEFVELPERLADGLDALWQRTRDIVLDEAAVEWAWELADQSAWDWPEWRSAAAWGKGARMLLRHWWQTAPSRELSQIEALVDKPDLRDVLAATVESGTCVLAGAHVGPTGGAVDLFQRGNRSFHTLGNADRARAGDATLIPIMSNPVATLRTLVSRVRGAGMIGLMADAAISQNTVEIDFLDRRVTLPLQAPRLVQQYRLPSFWCCPLWRRGRIMIELERLPDPSKHEPRDAWCRRWFAAYLSRLEKVMRGPPENLGLFSGIWGNVNATVLQQREKTTEARRTAQHRH
jgi:hypothetical protein